MIRFAYGALRGSSSGSSVAILAVIMSMTGCCGHDPPKSPYDQSVSELRIEPPVLHMQAGTQALMEILALGGQGSTLVRLPEFAIDTASPYGETIATDRLVTWSATSSNSGSVDSWIAPHPRSPHKYRAILSIPRTVTEDKVEIVAEADGKTAKATVIVAPASQSPQGQNVVTGPNPRDPHSVSVAVTDGTGPPDKVQAFQWEMEPEALVAPGTKHLALLSDYARISTDTYFPTNSVPIPPGAVPTPAEPMPTYMVPVRLWLANENLFIQDELDTARRRIRDEFALANEIFRSNRVGIQLDAGPSADGLPTVHSLAGYAEPSPAELLTCPELRGQIENLTSFQDTLPSFKEEYEKIMLHLLYLPTTAVGTFAPRGRECAIIDGKKSFVAVFWKWQVPPVLAHEVAHALGLASDVGSIKLGHTTGYSASFDPGNLMWEHSSLQQAVDRSRLSLGQALWMTLDTTSHLRYAVDPAHPSNPIRPEPPVDCITDEACAPQELGIRDAQ